MTKILILGGGFGGVNVLKKIQDKFSNHKNVKISIVSENNYFLYTPMLPSVASGMIHPNDITIPIRKLCKQAEFYQAQISSIDLKQKLVTITRRFDGKVHALDYDYLILSIGSDTNFFGNANIEKNAFTIKTVEDAIAIRAQVIKMLENAAQTSDVDFKKKLLAFTVIGGGFAGVETMGEINQLVRDSVKNFYPSAGDENITMVLVTSQDKILPEIGPKLGSQAAKYLEKAGVRVITGCKAVDVTEDYVELDNGEKIECMTLVWAAGTTPDSAIQNLDCEHQKSHKIIVDNYLRLAGHPNVYGLGDCISIINPHTRKEYPPTAQNAIHQSSTVAENLYQEIQGGKNFKEFNFRSKGMMTTLGRKLALADLYGLQIHGACAWFIWRTYYLSKLPMREKRFRVGFSWLIDLLFKRDLTFVGMIKKKTLTKVNVKPDSSSIKDFFKSKN